MAFSAWHEPLREHLGALWVRPINHHLRTFCIAPRSSAAPYQGGMRAVCAAWGGPFPYARACAQADWSLQTGELVEVGGMTCGPERAPSSALARAENDATYPT